MSVIVDVKKHYMLQVGPDPNNWIAGPKRIKVRDKGLLVGQMHKVNMVEDDGSPSPVIVTAPVAPTDQGRTDSFWGRGDAEVVTSEVVSDPELSDYERHQAMVPRAKELMENQNATAQANAKKRVAEARAFMDRQKSGRARTGIIEHDSAAVEVVAGTGTPSPPPGPTEPAPSAPTTVPEQALLTRARPITTAPGVEAIEEVHEIGANAEERLAQEAKAPPPAATKGIMVEGVSRETIQRALAVVAAGARVPKAVELLEQVEQGNMVVMSPPDFRAKLTEFGERSTAQLTEAMGELQEAAEGLSEKAALLQEEVTALHVELDDAYADKGALKEEVEKMQTAEKNRMLTGASPKNEKDKVVTRTSKKVAKKTSAKKKA